MNTYEKKIIKLAIEILESNLKTKEYQIDSIESVKNILRLKIELFEREVFVVLFLDTQNKLIELREMFQGTIDTAPVYPREVLKAALELNAASVIFAHNHPSGNSEPSSADRRITEHLKQALSLVDIRTLDHIVVGQGELTSFVEKGLL